MSSIINSMLAPINQLFANTAQLVAPQQQAQTGHLADPAQVGDTAHDNIILNRFLQQFEYVELDYPVSGDLEHPEKPLMYHPHIHFRMCGDDRKSMNPDQINTYLSREIDRGTYILKRLGLEIEDFYINTDKGELRFDGHVPNPPEGMTERQVLESITQGLQEACKQARAARGQAAGAQIG